MHKKPTSFTELKFSHLFFTRFLMLLVIAGNLITTSAQAEDWIYTTRPGDTLWDISQKYLKSVNYWSRLQQHNNVDVAKQLAPGTKLRMPLSWLKSFAAPATLVSISGDVRLRTAGTDSAVAVTGKQSINIGDTLITANKGSALIQFADGSTLLLQKNSEVIFNTLSSFGDTGMVDTQLRLQQGRVETRVKPLRNPDSRFEITTPAAVAAVRGTEFRVSYQITQQAMASEVLKGGINVAAAGKDQPVEEGFGTVTERGKAPLPPVPLLAAPQLDQMAKTVRHLPFSFTWPSIENALAYRVQITPAADGSTPVIDDTSEQPAYVLHSLDAGQYLIKIRGIDKLGLEGANSVHSFTRDKDLPVVQIVSPVSGSELNQQPVVLQWSPAEGVTRYRLELADNKAFNEAIINTETDLSEITLAEPLPAGPYFWRIAAIDAQGNRGNYSESGEFVMAEKNHKIWLLLFFLLPVLI